MEKVENISMELGQVIRMLTYNRDVQLKLAQSANAFRDIERTFEHFASGFAFQDAVDDLLGQERGKYDDKPFPDLQEDEGRD